NMDKKILSLSIVAALSTNLFGSNEDLAKKIEELEAKLAKIEKTQKKEKKKLNKIKQNTSGDNLKFSVDFRNQVDMMEYKYNKYLGNAVEGTTKSNDIITSRLDISMVSSPSNNIVFKSKMGINNVWGGHPAYSDTSTKDWQSSNKPNDHTVRVKEAILIYNTDNGITWSLGRRPSSDGFLANHRQNTQNPNSPLAHVTNMEVDAGMIKLGEEYTKIEGSFVKLVAGRAHDPVNSVNDPSYYAPYATDAVYTNTTSGVTEDDKDVNFIGLLGNAYYDGTYKVMFQRMAIMNTKGYNATDSIKKVGAGTACLTSVGLEVNGLDEDNDFLSETIVFASFGMSEYDPDNGYKILGSEDKESGTSIWVGTTFPDMISDDGKFGIEYNQGSKYWTPMTWAEDSITGSKIAVRGKAIEAYWNKKIGGSDNLTAQVRYTKIQHDYTPNVRCAGWVAPQEVDIVATNMSLSLRYQF
ncbi:MAG: DUF3373 family protein, partial [Campylobacterota bacterium]|nr:DUF3373 family protein [Campylobacterota bacterium]